MKVKDLQGLLEMAAPEAEVDLLLILGSRVMSCEAKSWEINFLRNKVLISNREGAEWKASSTKVTRTASSATTR